MVRYAAVQDFQRARNGERKELRRQHILTAATALIEDGLSFGQVTVAGVADRAGLAKGTVFLYFPTKEALFLGLLEDKLSDWFSALGAAVGGDEGLSPVELAGVFMKTLHGRETLPKLLGLLQSLLEHNLTPERIREFKLYLAGELLEKGHALEASAPFIAPGGGAQLLVHVAAMAVGLGQLADPPAAAKAVLESDPALGALRIDFEEELHRALTALFLGFWKRPPKEKANGRTQREGKSARRVRPPSGTSMGGRTHERQRPGRKASSTRRRAPQT